MTKIIQYTILIAAFISLTGCSWIETKEIENTGNEPVVDTSPKANLPVAYSSKKASIQQGQAGVTHIRRYGKSFDIDVMLDTTDDNVYFEMVLPKYAKNEEDGSELPEDLQKEDKEKDNKEDAAEEEMMEDEDREPTAEEIAQSSRHILYAQTYFYEGAFDRALSEVNQAIKLNKKSAVAYALKGTVHYKLNEMNKAKVAWKTALDIDPGIDNVRYMLEKLEQ